MVHIRPLKKNFEIGHHFSLSYGFWASFSRFFFFNFVCKRVNERGNSRKLLCKKKKNKNKK